MPALASPSAGAFLFQRVQALLGARAETAPWPRHWRWLLARPTRPAQSHTALIYVVLRTLFGRFPMLDRILHPQNKGRVRCNVTYTGGQISPQKKGTVISTWPMRRCLRDVLVEPPQLDQAIALALC